MSRRAAASGKSTAVAASGCTFFALIGMAFVAVEIFRYLIVPLLVQLHNWTRRSAMKRIGKWLLGLITSALTLVLVIVLLPYAAKWVARIMPDESAAAIRASVVLSQKLEQSAKLETLHVTEEGALNYEIKAAFLGTVASINADYTYEGQFRH